MELKQALEQIRDGYFSPENPSQFNDIYNSIVNYDTCENYNNKSYTFKGTLTTNILTTQVPLMC